MPPDPARSLIEQSSTDGTRVRGCAECGEERPIQARGLCRRCYKRWKRTTDPDYAARERASSVRWKDRNREANRARDNAHKADETRRGRCDKCGGPMGIGQFHDATCQACLSQAHNKRWTLIERMWSQGATLKEIAAELGSTPGAVAVDVHHMRATGIELAYRQKRKVAV